MLVRRFQWVYADIKKRIGELGAYLSRKEKSYNRLKLHIETLEHLYHKYQIIKRRGVNLW